MYGDGDEAPPENAENVVVESRLRTRVLSSRHCQLLVVGAVLNCLGLRPQHSLDGREGLRHRKHRSVRLAEHPARTRGHVWTAMVRLRFHRSNPCRRRGPGRDIRAEAVHPQRAPVGRSDRVRCLPRSDAKGPNARADLVLLLPQHPDEHRPEYAILLAVDQELS
jgi:hypothetical protein